ncbi:MAG: aminopeptidase P family protein [Magnetococcales bacterium]|nr:aminopeptidase P family protein [Magnetococcales bacterium]
MATAKLIYAAGEASADMYYATGLFTPDAFLYLEDQQGTRHILISALEIDRARRVAHVDEIHDWEKTRDACHAHDQRSPNIASLVTYFLRQRGVEVAEVPGTFPLGLADLLRRAGITLTATDGIFFPQRAVKTPAEVAAIREALEITGQGMEVGIGLIIASKIGNDGLLHLDGQPLTSERVRGEISAHLAREGATASHTIVAGGEQGADPHEKGSGPLRAHWPIILDIFPRVERTGYWGDMSRTVCKGQPSERVRRAWEAVRQAQEVACARIRPGASGYAIHQAVRDHLTAAGFVTGPTADGRQGGFFHGTGHGVGLDIHESPRISEQESVLQAGHVVTVEPGLYYPDMGGVRLEDVVLVEESGCTNLTTYPKFLEV